MHKILKNHTRHAEYLDFSGITDTYLKKYICFLSVEYPARERHGSTFGPPASGMLKIYCTCCLLVYLKICMSTSWSSGWECF